MLADLLLPAPTDLQLFEVLAPSSMITLVVATTAATVACPRCGAPTQRRHSFYQRTLADTPWANVAVRLRLRTRRFFCANPACPRRIFTERVPALTRSSARRTTRLTTILQKLGQALGGEAGARLGPDLGLPTSPTTLLRLVRQTPDPPASPAHIVGLDDFAFRKGHTYGTIVIDHETGQTIDLLADRKKESVAAWLQAHPGVTIITRDRGEVYAEGATLGAPQAIQVCDRWHLLCNLSETLDEIFTRLHAELGQALASGAPAPAADPGETLTPPRGGPTAAGAAAPAPAAPLPARSPGGNANVRMVQLQQARRAERVARYEEVRRRRQAGQAIAQIAREVGLGERTVNRFLRAGVFPERQERTPAASPLDPYKPYLRERCAAGCTNRARLWREIEAQGYTGGYASVYAWLHAAQVARRAERGGAQGPNRPRVSRRKWKVRFGQPAGKLTAREAQEVAQVCAGSAVLGTVYALAQEFGQMVRERQRAQLDGWLQRALASGVEELARFARGLAADYAAVAAALELAFSNGPTEGHVNRLKLVKRSMFGRAKFDLLRKRVLGAT